MFKNLFNKKKKSEPVIVETVKKQCSFDFTKPIAEQIIIYDYYCNFDKKIDIFHNIDENNTIFIFNDILPKIDDTICCYNIDSYVSAYNLRPYMQGEYFIFKIQEVYQSDEKILARAIKIENSKDYKYIKIENTKDIFPNRIAV